MATEGMGLEITELRLGLPGGRYGGGGGGERMEKKRAFSNITGGVGGGGGKNRNMDQVVGWPPLCTYRKKNVSEVTKMYVKVSMDGAPFLRKIDMSGFKGYSDLVMALEKLFDCHGVGESMKEDKYDGCEYIPIYEDKDGDWMLVGDVPWEMFTETCKRLRIKKRSEGNGIGLHTKNLMTS